MIHILKNATVLKHAGKHFAAQIHGSARAQTQSQRVQTRSHRLQTPGRSPRAHRGWSVCSPGTAGPGGIIRSHPVQPPPEDELCLKHCQCLKSSLFNLYFKTCVNDFIMFSGNVLQGFAKLPSGLFSPNASSKGRQLLLIL